MQIWGWQQHTAWFFSIRFWRILIQIFLLAFWNCHRQRHLHTRRYPREEPRPLLVRKPWIHFPTNKVLVIQSCDWLFLKKQNILCCYYLLQSWVEFELTWICLQVSFLKMCYYSRYMKVNKKMRGIHLTSVNVFSSTSSVVNKSKSTQTQTQLIIVADNSNTCFKLGLFEFLEAIICMIFVLRKLSFFTITTLPVQTCLTIYHSKSNIQDYTYTLYFSPAHWIRNDF